MSKRKQMVERGFQVEVENVTLPSATDSGPNTIILSPRNIYEKEETIGNKKSSAAGRYSTNPSNRSQTRHMQTYEMVSIGTAGTKDGGKQKSKSPRTKLKLSQFAGAAATTNVSNLDYLYGVPNTSGNNSRSNSMSMRSGIHPYTPAHATSKGHMKRSSQTRGNNQQYIKTSRGPNIDKAKLQTSQNNNGPKTLAPIERVLKDISDTTSVLQQPKSRMGRLYQSLDAKISQNKLPRTKYRPGGNPPSRANQPTPTEEFVKKNEAMQRILNKSLMEEKSVNFNRWDKSENFEQSYVSNLNQTTQNFAYMHRKNDSPMLEQIMSPIAAAAQRLPSKMQTKSKFGPSRAANGDLNLTADSPEKCPETVSQTMQQMVDNFKKSLQQDGLAPLINNRRKQLQESILDRQPVDVNTSQTYSSGFFDHNTQLKGFKANHLRMSQTRFKDDNIGQKSLETAKFKDQQSIRGSQRGSNMILTRKMNASAYRTDKSQESFEDQISMPRVARMMGDEDDLPVGATVNLDSLQNSFESLNFVDQARVMRIGLNEKRLDRFLNLYESNHQGLHSQIRRQGNNIISKSIEIDGFKANTVKMRDLRSSSNWVKNIAQEENKMRIEQEQMRATRSIMSSKMSSKLPKVVKPLNLPPTDHSNRVKIDEGTFEMINLAPQFEKLVEVRRPYKIKPYMPETTQNNMKGQTGSLETLDISDYNAEMAVLEQQSSKNQVGDEYIPQLKRSKLMNMDIRKVNMQKLNQKQKSMLRCVKAQVRNKSKHQNFQIVDILSSTAKQAVTDTLKEKQLTKLIGPKNTTETEDGEESQQEEIMQEDSELQTSSSFTSDDTQYQPLVRGQPIKDDLSVTSKEIHDHQMAQTKFMEDLFTKTIEFTEKLNEKNNSKVMVGKSKYGFPSIEEIKDYRYRIINDDLEQETRATLPGGESQFGLTMVKHDKASNFKEKEVPPEINQHVSFLTDEIKQSLGGDQAIFKKDPLNKKPGANYTFDELVALEQCMLQDNADEFDKRILYSQINKIANMPNIKELYAEHPEYIYYMECSTDNDTPLPILSHIINNTLTLANYTLSSGHCKGLNTAAKYLQTNINRVRFDNCGIDDLEMSNLLQAFFKFKDFKSIIYRQNELSELSLPWLSKLLAKSIPYHLQELRISGCHLTPQITSQLIEVITKKSYLKQFELSKDIMSDDDALGVAEFCMASKNLEDLDLSANDLLPKAMDILLSVIRENKKLLFLNIAHNNLIEGNFGNNEAVVQATQEKVIGHLYRFLRHNRRLIHLDLTSTNLSETAIMSILPAIKRAKNLQGIHLSGNPGVTEAVKAEAKTLLKTKPEEERKTLILSRVLLPETIQAMNRTFLRESVKLKHINNGKRLVQAGATDTRYLDLDNTLGKRTLDAGPIIEDGKLIFMRYLHHKTDIPGVGQWQMMTQRQDHCWLCDKEIKGYIFWCPGMDQKSNKSIQLEPQEKLNIYNELEEVKAYNKFIPAKPKPYIAPESPKMKKQKSKQDDQEEEKKAAAAGKAQSAEPDPQPTYRKDPVICGQFTNWKPRPMQTIFDFMQQKAPEEEKLDYRSVFKYFCSKFKWGSQLEIDKFEECTTQHFYMMDNFIKDRRQELYFDWQVALERMLTYKKPFFVNSQVVRRMPNEEVYIAPLFAKSGRQMFVIQSGDSHETIELYKTLVDFRQEDVPAKFINTQVQETIKIFKKPLSVFAKWRTDNDTTREKCLAHDFVNWKLDNFVKEESQNAGMQEVIKENFYLLKSIFTEAAAETAFPCITQAAFSHIIQKHGLLDEQRLGLADVDRFFIAARVSQKGAKQQHLRRYMFFEAFIRVALKRYYDEGRGDAETKVEAVKMAIEEIKRNVTESQWEDWRWKYLYMVSIDLTLSANITKLQDLYRKYTGPQRRYINVEEVQQMFVDVGDIGITPQQVKYCFFMSKQTIIDEKDKKLSIQYNELDFVEFLEFLGRVSPLKFQGSELEDQIDLTTKIEYVMDDLLALIDTVRNEVEQESDESAESGAEESDDY